MAARLNVTGGSLIVEVAGGPTDPGFGGGIGAGHPDNSLPPGFPPIGSTLPEPPPGIWPPITGWAPIQPAPPDVPPGAIWPPIGHPGHPLPPSPGHPDAGLPPSPGRPDAGLPPAPARPGTPLPTPPSGTLPARPPVVPGHDLPSQVYWVVVGIPGVGWRYAAIDPSLTVGHPLPPTAEPKG
jgi:hypothetical protein